MAIIRPVDLPAAASVAPGDALIVDKGSTVNKATPIQIVDAAIPLASQAEAEAGVDNEKRVTPLRVKQAISAIANGTIQPTAETTADLLAITTAFPPGNLLTTLNGFAYEVADPSATDNDLITAGGVKLYALPSADGSINVMQFGAVGDDVTDDWPAFNAAINFSRGTRAGYSITVIVPEPPVRYYLSDELNFKLNIHFKGNGGGGLDNPTPVTIRFPADTRGMIVNRANTFSDGVVASTTSAAGAIIENISLIGGGGTDLNAHGFMMRGRAVLRDFRIYNFAGNGLNIVATSGSGTPANEGNANNFAVERGRITNCGAWGCYVDGADANSGGMWKVDCSDNARGGFFDGSFLGNTYIACHTNGNGLALGTCSYLGVRYGAAAFATDADLVNTTPGTNEAVWYTVGAGGPGGGAYPAWTAGQPAGTWKWGGAYVSDDINARNVWLGCYSESAQPRSYFSRSDFVAGGLHAAGIAQTSAIIMVTDTAKIPTLLASTGEFAVNTSGFGVTETHWNQASVSSSRGVAIKGRVGPATGFIETGQVVMRATASNTTHKTRISLQYYDGATSTFIDGWEVRGDLSDLVPGTDNLVDLGDASKRFKEIFAGNATINTSDEREKEQIGEIPDEWLDAWGDVQWSRFKWKDAVAEKGDEARWHVGVIAQQVRDAFAARGLDAAEIGVLCYDEWEEEIAPVYEEYEEDEVYHEREYVPPSDGETEGRYEVVEKTRTVTKTRETGETRVVLEAGNRWGVRYAQAQALESAWMRRALAQMSA